MKKKIMISLLITVVFLLTGCGQASTEENTAGLNIQEAETAEVIDLHEYGVVTERIE